MALIKIVEGAIAGTDTWTDVEKKLEQLGGQVIAKTESSLELFADQFLTDFGSQALSISETAVADAAEGDSIQTIAAKVVPQITAAAVTDAEKAGAVVLNAVRVQLTAAAAQASGVAASTAPAPSSPPSTPAANPAS